MGVLVVLYRLKLYSSIKAKKGKMQRVVLMSWTEKEVGYILQKGFTLGFKMKGQSLTMVEIELSPFPFVEITVKQKFLIAKKTSRYKDKMGTTSVKGNSQHENSKSFKRKRNKKQVLIKAS